MSVPDLKAVCQCGSTFFRIEKCQDVLYWSGPGHPDLHEMWDSETRSYQFHPYASTNTGYRPVCMRCGAVPEPKDFVNA